MPVRGDTEDFNSSLRLFCGMTLGKSFRQPFSAVDGKNKKKEMEEKCVRKQRGGGEGENRQTTNKSLDSVLD